MIKWIGKTPVSPKEYPLSIHLVPAMVDFISFLCLFTHPQGIGFLEKSLCLENVPVTFVKMQTFTPGLYSTMK